VLAIRTPAHQRIAYLVCDTLVCSLEVKNHMILTGIPEILPFVVPAIRSTNG
jgi:hypothetical protein